MELIHGTCLAVDGRGVLLLGSSGVGKSDLALRLIDQPGLGIGGKLKTAQLVSDDQVVLRRLDGRVEAAAPAVIAGQIELRGLGPVAIAASGPVTLALVVELKSASRIERLPEASALFHTLLGIALPAIAVDPSQASAPARIRAALDLLEQGHFASCNTP